MTTPFEELIERVNILERTQSQQMHMIIKRFDTVEDMLEKVIAVVGQTQEQVNLMAKVLYRRLAGSDTNYEHVSPEDEERKEP